MKRLKELLLILSLCALAVTPAAVAGNASALSPNPINAVADSTGDACNGLQQLGGTNCPQNGGNPQGTIGNLVGSVVGIISYIAGAIAIIMIITSGIRFTTSGGDSAKVGAAKTALVYALIGIAVAGISQILVHFVLSSAAGF